MQATSEPRPFAGVPGRAVHLVGLLLLVALTLWCNARWVSENHQPPLDDDNTHLMTAMDLTRAVAAAPTLTAAASTMLWWRSLYPPAGYWVSAAWMRRAGTSVNAAIHSLSLYVALLIVSCFAASWALSGPRAAWMAALMAATCPLALQFSRVFFLDVPETALVAASFAALCCSRDLRCGPSAVLAGVAAGLAVLLKSPAAVIVIIPPALMSLAWLGDRAAWAPFTLMTALIAGTGYGAVRLGRLLMTTSHGDEVLPIVLALALSAGAFLVAVGICLRRSGRPASIAAGNGLWAAAAACTVAAPWYVVNLRAISAKWAAQDLAFVHGFTQREAARLAATDIACMYWLSGPLIGIGLLYAVYRNRRAPAVIWASVAALGVMVWWIYLSGWSSRYVLPVLPFMIALSTWWLDAVPRVVARVLVPYLVVGMSWQLGGAWVMDLGVGTRMPRFNQGGPQWSLLPFTTLPPEREGYPVEDFLRAIEKDPNGRWITVGVMQKTVNHTYRPLDGRALQVYDRLDPRNLRFMTLAGDGQQPHDPGNAGNLHPECDYLLVTFCPAPKDDDWMKPIIELQKWKLDLVLDRALPHDLDMRLYKVRSGS